jgi:hypothetical protein
MAEAAFSTEGNPPNPIRVCLDGPQGRNSLQAMKQVPDIVEDPHHLYLPMM